MHVRETRYHPVILAPALRRQSRASKIERWNHANENFLLSNSLTKKSRIRFLYRRSTRGCKTKSLSFGIIHYSTLSPTCYPITSLLPLPPSPYISVLPLYVHPPQSSSAAILRLCLLNFIYSNPAWLLKVTSVERKGNERNGLSHGTKIE